MALLTMLAPQAGAQDLTEAADACREAGGDPRQCRGLEHLAHTLGVVCREVADNCTNVDGTAVSPERVAAHERSWLARALALQRGLDDDNPLHEELWTHTHNSYNADVYPLTIYGLDRNQIYSVTDQLRMGIRAVELDLHWAHGASGDPAQGGKGVVVCHGTQIPAPVTTIHAGCGLNDPTLDSFLIEIRDWLRRNRNEVVMIYFENQLEGNASAHALAARTIERILGPLVYRPSSRCAPLPFDRTRRDIRRSGARVILTGDCGPGAWGAWVHLRGPRWIESGLDHGDDFPAYPCTERRRAQNYARNWIRHWGDETGLSNAAGEGGDVTLSDARNMVRCGVNMIGLDNLVPFDRRLERLVWSWGPNQPRSGDCAYQGGDGRFRSGDCGDRRRFACFDGRAWTASRRAGPWRDGVEACRSSGTAFSVPRTGYENERLRAASRGGEVWLAYRRNAGAWRPS
jgi:hypothetical protein